MERISRDNRATKEESERADERARRDDARILTLSLEVSALATSNRHTQANAQQRYSATCERREKERETSKGRRDGREERLSAFFSFFFFRQHFARTRSCESRKSEGAKHREDGDSRSWELTRTISRDESAFARATKK